MPGTPGLRFAIVVLAAVAALQLADPAGASLGGGRPAALEAREELDFPAHVAALKKRLPHRGFTVLAEPPFVVVGDEAPDMVRRRARQTVKWATDLLKKDFFQKDPPHIIDVWLFKDKASYEKYTKELFDDEPTTPFGYYSHRHRALIMNISTGGGTLVHEIVHPFVAANFPACPAWFNEGLGSLYEQCREKDGKITGLTNWRLRGLQAAIRERRVPTIATLCATTDAAFYNESRGVHYAMARYILYYLQERSLLRPYYRAFHAARETDPTGLTTLKKILEIDDLAAFQKTWQEYVLGLRFRG